MNHHAFQTLFALPLVLLLVNLLGLVVCAACLVSCVCRVNAAKVIRGRVTFTQLMYLAFALWAFGTFLDLAAGIVLGWHQGAVGLGIVLHLLSTYRFWIGEDPVCDYWAGECNAHTANG